MLYKKSQFSCKNHNHGLNMRIFSTCSLHFLTFHILGIVFVLGNMRAKIKNLKFCIFHSNSIVIFTPLYFLHKKVFFSSKQSDCISFQVAPSIEENHISVATEYDVTSGWTGSFWRHCFFFKRICDHIFS